MAAVNMPWKNIKHNDAGAKTWLIKQTWKRCKSDKNARDVH